MFFQCSSGRKILKKIRRFSSYRFLRAGVMGENSISSRRLIKQQYKFTLVRGGVFVKNPIEVREKKKQILN